MSINPNRSIITYDNVMLLRGALDAHGAASNSGANLSHVPYVQSVSFSFDTNKQHLGSIGTTETVYTNTQQSPNVNLEISVIENLDEMFSIFRGVGTTGFFKDQLITGLAELGGGGVLDATGVHLKKTDLNKDLNFYCVVGPERGVGHITGNNISFSGHDCIGFGNCFLNSVSTSQSVNGVMESTYSFTASNVQAQKIENKVLYFNDFENLDEASYRPASYSSGATIVSPGGATGYHDLFFTGSDTVSGRMFTGALVSYSDIDDNRGLIISSGYLGGVVNADDTDGLGITESIGVSGMDGQKCLAIYDTFSINGFTFSGFTPTPYNEGDSINTRHGSPDHLFTETSAGGLQFNAEDIYLVSGRVRNTEGGQLSIRFQTGNIIGTSEGYQSLHNFPNVEAEDFFATGNFGSSASGILWVAHRKSGTMYDDLTGFKNVEANQLDYAFINAPGCTFFDAMTGAEMNNGRLVCIDTEEKLNRFENFITGTGSRNGGGSYLAPTGFVNAGGHSHGHNSNTYRGWIGLTDSGSEAAGTLTEKRQDFKWINNVANIHTGNTIWGSSEPSNSSNEDFVLVNLNSSGSWNDVSSDPTTPVNGFYMERITTASFLSDLTIRNLNQFQVQAPSVSLTGSQKQDLDTTMSGMDFYYSNQSGRYIPSSETHVNIKRNSFELNEFIIVDSGVSGFSASADPASGSKIILPEDTNDSLKIYVQSAATAGNINQSRDYFGGDGLATMLIEINGQRVYNGLESGVATNFVSGITLSSDIPSNAAALSTYIPSGNVQKVRGHTAYYKSDNLANLHSSYTGYAILKANDDTDDTTGYALYANGASGLGDEIIQINLSDGTLADGSVSVAGLDSDDVNVIRVNKYRSHAIGQDVSSHTGYLTSLKRGIGMAKISHNNGNFKFVSGILCDTFNGVDQPSFDTSNHTGHYGTGKALEFLQDFDDGDILVLNSRDAITTTVDAHDNARTAIYNILSGDFGSKRIFELKLRDQIALVAIKGKGIVYEEYLNSSGTNLMAPDSQPPQALVYLPKDTSNFLIQPDALQNFNLDIPINRKQINSLGKKYPVAKRPLFPSRGSISFSNIVSNFINSGDNTNSSREAPITQNLNNFINKNSTYTIDISGFYADETKYNLTIKNATLESQSFSSSIGNRASSDMAYSFDIENVSKNDHLNNLNNLYIYLDRQNLNCYKNGETGIFDLSYKPDGFYRGKTHHSKSLNGNIGTIASSYKGTSANLSGFIYTDKTGFIFQSNDKSFIAIDNEIGSNPEQARQTGNFTYLAWIDPSKKGLNVTNENDGIVQEASIMRQRFGNESRNEMAIQNGALRFQTWDPRDFKKKGQGRKTISTESQIGVTLDDGTTFEGLYTGYQQIAITYEESTGTFLQTPDDYTGVLKFYHNEDHYFTTGVSFTPQTSSTDRDFYIGGDWQTNGSSQSDFFNGRLAIAALYIEKTLSHDDIKDNFQRLKGRFGLPKNKPYGNS